MFVNNANGQRGLVCQYDVVCFDEISGVSFDQKDGVNILKGYMESGEFSRGKESIRAEGGIVMVGNLDVEVEHQQRVGHLLSPLPPEMRDDTAFMDRIHAYAPGWDFPKLNPNEHFTDHFGLVSDFLSECWSRLRTGSRVPVLQGRVNYGGALSGRDITAANKTVSGLIKLLYPDPEMTVPDEELEEMVRVALEVRRRVKEQQKRVFKSEFRNTHFSYAMGEDGVEKFVSTPELHSDEAIELDPLPPGQVWGISPGGPETGASLYRLEVTVGKGSGVKILNAPVPPAFRESVRYAEQNLYTRAKQLVGDRDPRSHEFSVTAPCYGQRPQRNLSRLAGSDGPLQRLAREKYQGRADRGRRAQPRRFSRTVGECRRHHRSRCRERRGYRADARVGAEAAVRALRRYGNADQHPVLLGYAGCAVESPFGVSVNELKGRRGDYSAGRDAGTSCVT